MVKKKTTRKPIKTRRKSKKKTKSKSAYFEYQNIIGSIHKFWRIVKDGTKITTHYGKIGSLGRMATKDYGSKVDVKYDQLTDNPKIVFKDISKKFNLSPTHKTISLIKKIKKRKKTILSLKKKLRKEIYNKLNQLS